MEIIDRITTNHTGRRGLTSQGDWVQLGFRLPMSIPKMEDVAASVLSKLMAFFMLTLIFIITVFSLLHIEIVFLSFPMFTLFPGRIS
jgi:hypothetical protein